MRHPGRTLQQDDGFAPLNFVELASVLTMFETLSNDQMIELEHWLSTDAILETCG